MKTNNFQIFWDSAWSRSGGAIMIGAIGVVASIVQLGINVDSIIPVKYVVPIIIIFLWCLVVCMCIIHDLTKESMGNARFVPFKKYNDNILLIKNTDHISVNTVVGIFHTDGVREKCIGIGHGLNKQETITQVKIISLESADLINDLNSLYISTSIPHEIIQTLARKADHEG